MTKHPERQKAEGVAEKAEGRAQEAAGAVTGETDDKMEGKWKQAKGEAKKKVAEAREAIKENT